MPTNNFPRRGPRRGPRVTLRDLMPTDFDAVHSFASDPAVVQWSTWGPNTPEETRSFLDGAVAEAAAPERPGFTLAVTVNCEVVGTAAVWTTSPADRNGELGYTLAKDAWGQGIGTETAGLLLDHAFDTVGLERVEATCHPDNTGSVRVLEKNGFRFEGRLRGHKSVNGQRRDSLLFAALRIDRMPLRSEPEPDRLAAGPSASQQ
ncbi:GNAT family N-acetyltransferase [Arthrobacter sp. YD2]|uniref:GNAT family N-acetyltransferase n=1 Tax=Arthrobacter sp. YD2 TaxID=3058046 RepID=UPI0025B2E192|nr:GNAT family N-acetyltransferase [Arthrobacter sp. YD2]MDN3905947.1 GNAT family N-acetyltransferase [Arthrobacter sp. YD2]